MNDDSEVFEAIDAETEKLLQEAAAAGSRLAGMHKACGGIQSHFLNGHLNAGAERGRYAVDRLLRPCVEAWIKAAGGRDGIILPGVVSEEYRVVPDYKRSGDYTGPMDALCDEWVARLGRETLLDDDVLKEVVSTIAARTFKSSRDAGPSAVFGVFGRSHFGQSYLPRNVAAAMGMTYDSLMFNESSSHLLRFVTRSKKTGCPHLIELWISNDPPTSKFTRVLTDAVARGVIPCSDGTEVSLADTVLFVVDEDDEDYFRRIMAIHGLEDRVDRFIVCEGYDDVLIRRHVRQGIETISLALAKTGLALRVTARASDELSRRIAAMDEEIHQLIFVEVRNEIDDVLMSLVLDAIDESYPDPFDRYVVIDFDGEFKCERRRCE